MENDNKEEEAKKIERIGILGGIFDPPTISHLQMAIEAINNSHLDQVVLVPCGQRCDKHVETPPQHRYNMLQICMQEYLDNQPFPITLGNYEVQCQQRINTYQLMKYYQQMYPSQKYQLYFIIGEILLEELTNWDDYQELNSQFSFLIYSFRQPGTPMNYVMPRDYKIIYTTFVASESFHIKKRIKKVLQQIKSEQQQEQQEEQEQHQQQLQSQQSLQSLEELKVNSSMGQLPDNTKALPKFSNDLKKQYSQKQFNNFQKKYLGVYGITTIGVIKYIIEHQLYQEKEQK